MLCFFRRVVGGAGDAGVLAAKERVSTRLLRTGVDFVKAGGKNPGILLDLTSTERSIVQQALGLAEK